MRKIIISAAILVSFSNSYVQYAEAEDSKAINTNHDMACIQQGGNVLDCSNRCATLGIYFLTCV